MLFLCFVAPALLVTPLWQRVGEARGKRTGYLWGSVLLLVGAAATLATVRVGLAAAALNVAVVGIGYAACQMFPLAMLPDVAAADAAATGEDRAGTYTGVWTAGRRWASRSARSCMPPCSPSAATCRRRMPERANLIRRRSRSRSGSCAGRARRDLLGVPAQYRLDVEVAR